MSLMTKKPILFITEGAAEKNFIEILFNLIAKGEEYEVYSYDTNIHILAQELTKEGVIDEFLDINLVLREKETDPRLREMLSKNFSDMTLNIVIQVLTKCRLCLIISPIPQRLEKCT